MSDLMWSVSLPNSFLRNVLNGVTLNYRKHIDRVNNVMVLKMENKLLHLTLEK